MFSTLSLYNPTDERLAFKVKTTSPERYCVRPCTGVLDPDNSLDLQVILRAFDSVPVDMEGCFDKFLVQSTPVGAQDSTVTPEMFDGSRAGAISETLLNVTLSHRQNPVLLGRFLDSAEDSVGPIERNEDTVTEFNAWPQGSTERSPGAQLDQYHTMDEETFKRAVEGDISAQMGEGGSRDELEKRVARLEDAFSKSEAVPRALTSRGIDVHPHDGSSGDCGSFRKGPVITMKPWYLIVFLSASFVLGRLTLR
ncbi:hypothetical protein BSKO_01973 [Bryopsis sp. KO-2023]|nr:hypothetical protein BSKO_01973 [Bryopsis sp. KO-2023]